MLRATIWRDLRWRTVAAAVPVLVPAALVSTSYAHAPAAVRAAAGSYLAHLDAAWFHLPGLSAAFLVSAVILASAGSLQRPRRDVAYLLALPVSRTRWLLAHAAMCLAALAALLVLADVVLAIGAVQTGAPVAIVPLLGRSLLVWMAAGAWVCATLGVLGLMRHPIPAALLVLAAAAYTGPDRFKLDIPAQPSPRTLPPWDPWTFADPRAWSHGVPAASLLAAAALAAAGLLIAHHRLRRYEP